MFFKNESKGKSSVQIIEEIHNEFDTAQDRLLSEAKSILDNVVLSEVEKMESTAHRLKSLGFIKTALVKKADEITSKLVKSKEEASLIMYYKQTYPFLKFLTESELDRICKKWNLVYNSVRTYIKDVPEKNLKEIELSQPL